MAETIVEEGKLKCSGTITKGGLTGKECRRAILVKDPELGWGISCGRCSEFHPLRKILRDLVESGELDKKEILAAISNKKETQEGKMSKDLAIEVPRDIGKNPKEAFKLIAKIEGLKKTKDIIFDELFKEYFRKVFARGGRGYSLALRDEVNGILVIGYRKPLEVTLKAFEVGKIGHTEFMISGMAFWGDPEKEKDLPSWEKSESEKFDWTSIYREEDVVAYAQQTKKFFRDLGIKVSLEIKL